MRANEMLLRDALKDRLKKPRGLTPATAALLRTARLLMRGHVMVPASIWSPA